MHKVLADSSQNSSFCLLIAAKIKKARNKITKKIILRITATPIQITIPTKTYFFSNECNAHYSTAFL
jgi:hypothetical protein